MESKINKQSSVVFTIKCMAKMEHYSFRDNFVKITEIVVAINLFK